MKKNIIVTGGAGYIGSHTVVELINCGYKVIIVDNLSNSDISVLDGIEKITGIKPDFYNTDLSDKIQTAKFFSKVKDAIAVIHFAAFKAVGESVENPLKYYSNNINSLINVLEAMIDNDIKNIVFSSSCTVYGQPEILPVTEKSAIMKADSPYGNTKQISEEIISETIFSNSKLKSISLRYFNPIGAHESAEIGELPVGTPNNLVPFITQTAAGIRNELKVYGNDYNTPDGTPIRDYIHVVDLAKAHIVAIERLIDNKNSKNFEVFNLGTGKGNSVMEVINTFEEVSGEKLNYKIIERRKGDIEKIWADTSLSNEVLGWKPEKTLHEAILSAWIREKKYRNIK
jgi:UDP-glucose 4-epimerase